MTTRISLISSVAVIRQSLFASFQRYETWWTQISIQPRAHFQCDGKKTEFFLILLDIAIAIMLLSACATIAFQIWLHFLRFLLMWTYSKVSFHTNKHLFFQVLEKLSTFIRILLRPVRGLLNQLKRSNQLATLTRSSGSSLQMPGKTTGYPTGCHGCAGTSGLGNTLK